MPLVKRGSFGFAAAVLAMQCGNAAAATLEPAVCWDGRTLAAARVFEFRAIGLNVQLRCRLIGLDIMPGYASVLTRYQSDFDAAEGTIKAHYHADQGHGQWVEYQRYLTHVTNIYGGGATTLTHCRAFASVLGELSLPATPTSALESVAVAMVREPHIDTATCR
jgi:hypothetical protein